MPTACSSRFGIWQQIEHVQITVAETVGVEHRGKFYEKTGALRDMVLPNHVFQILAMTAMEPPISFDADAVRAKKTEVIAAIKVARSGAGVQGCGARPVRRRQGWLGKPVRGVPPGNPKVVAEFDDRDIYCLKAQHRQLALGRRAVLSAHRQVYETPIDRDRDPLSSSALCAISRHQRRANDIRTG